MVTIVPLFFQIGNNNKRRKKNIPQGEIDQGTSLSIFT